MEYEKNISPEFYSLLKQYTKSDDPLEDPNFDIIAYLNEKSIKHFYDFFMTNNFKELIHVLVRDKRISEGFLKVGKNQNFMSKDKIRSYEDYLNYIEGKKEFKGCFEIIHHKRIFSLPWLIKEVRDKLFRK